MTDTSEAVESFLRCKRIAVTGVSRTAKGHGANTVYRRLRDRGYEVYAVNPNSPESRRRRCLPEAGLGHEVGVRHPRYPPRVDAPGAGRRQRVLRGHHARTNHGMTVIDGAARFMYPPDSDMAHKVTRLVCARTGALPRTV